MTPGRASHVNSRGDIPTTAPMDGAADHVC